MTAPLYTTDSGLLWHAGKILIATAGLPARGKTHLAHALERYLLWLGVKVQVFSLGDYRRKKLGKPDALPADYFAPNGQRQASTERLRHQLRHDFDEEVRAYFKAGNQVVIYDANNGQEAVRAQLRNKFADLGVSVMFLETICDDPVVIERNVRSVKLTSPDYKGWSKAQAVNDFYRRIRTRQEEYETIADPHVPYIKIINVGERVIVNNIRGYLQSRICFFLMNVHNRDRTIYLARAGEALVEHLYKADADLSSLGWQYAEELTEFMDKLRKERLSAPASPSPKSPGVQTPAVPTPRTKSVGAYDRRDDATPRPTLASRPPSLTDSDTPMPRRLEVWTSNRRRAAHTCSFFLQQGDRVVEKSQLCELNPGVVDGLSEEEIKEQYPLDYARCQAEPYGARYPRAESYHDLCVRIEPVIMELERTSSDLLIVAQSSVLRVLLGYLQGRPAHEIPHIDVPEGQVIQITPQAYGMQSTTHTFWDPVARRRARDAAWVREQRAVSVSRAQSRTSSRAPSRTTSRTQSRTASPQLAPRSARSSAGTLPSPHWHPHTNSVLAPGPFPLTPAHSMTQGNLRSHNHHTAEQPVPGHAIPPLDLPLPDSSVVGSAPDGTSVAASVSVGSPGSASDDMPDEELDPEMARKLERRELQRVAALSQLADELQVDDEAPLLLQDPPELMF